jgi:hypothetical protein
MRAGLGFLNKWSAIFPKNRGEHRALHNTECDKIILLSSLAELDCFVSEQFKLPLRPYSTEIEASMFLALASLDSKRPHFEMFRAEDDTIPGIPFVVSFEPGVWGYGETAPLAICQAAVYRRKRVRVALACSNRL